VGLLATPAGARAVHEADSTPCSKRLISAHQGYRLNDDPDTVESQQAAFDVGSNIADSDLWVTQDGYLVEIHDDDVGHWTDGQGRISEMTLEQVKQLRTVPHGELVPQLADSFAIPVSHEAGRYFMFEAKPVFEDPGYQQKLVTEIQAAGMVDHVIIYTSGVRMAHALKTLDPNLTVWLKGWGDTVPPMSYVLGLDGIMLSPALITTEVVQQFHDVGIVVIRQRVATEARGNWNRFVSTGADGLMTDDPVFVINKCRKLP
jgi:glycerophosphoryl diester phosphodiesterase